MWRLSTSIDVTTDDVALIISACQTAEDENSESTDQFSAASFRHGRKLLLLLNAPPLHVFGSRARAGTAADPRCKPGPP